VLGILAVYEYQPQRVDLFPKAAPLPNPSFDPESKRLFSPTGKVLVVTAHPDDTEFYLGGFLTKLSQTHATVDEVVCTDGDKSYYLWQDAEKNRRVRRAEQIASARASTVRHVQFLGYPDGRLFPHDDVVERLHEEILKSKPEYLVAFDGEYPPKVYHRDHLNSGIAALKAAEGTSVKWVLLFATHAPNYTVDISDQFDQQTKLMAMHPSQWTGRKLQMVVNMVQETAMEAGERMGATYGVGFRVLRG
jgi:LmbE family N-acetylglucosaminyl deacetylase